MRWFPVPYLFWFAMRNVSTRSGLGLSFMTTVSIAGVAIGVATLIIVLSVMGGFENNLQTKMLKGEPHLELFNTNVQLGFSLDEFPVAEVAKRVPEATQIGPFTKADVVLKHDKNLQAAELVGIDDKPDSTLWIHQEQDAMTQGDANSIFSSHAPLLHEDGRKLPGIILGEGLVTNLGMNLGEELSIINPIVATSESAAGSADTSVRQYVLSGVFDSGDIKYDNKWAIVSVDEGRRYLADYDESLAEANVVTGIALRLKNPFIVKGIAKRFDDLKWLKATSWEQSNESLLFALKLEKFAMGSILMLIVLVAAFSISGTIMMTVFHKRTQVATLRALGMTRAQIAKLFMLHGCLIGFAGIIAGLILGLGVCYLVYGAAKINLPPGIYSLKKLPVKFLPATYVVIVTSAWLFSMLAAIYPALTAARQNTSAGLRFD